VTDDDLRARLRRADPATSLAPVAADRVSRLVEDTMTAVPTHPRSTASRRLLVAAAAAIALLAGGAGLLLTQNHQQAGGTAGAQPSITRIAAVGVAAKCSAPTPEVLAASADFAFAGTVTGIADDVVTLQVTHVYSGAAVDLVQVGQTGDISEGLVGDSDRFVLGERYLVASSEGQVLICGYSGDASAPDLQDLYDRAF